MNDITERKEKRNQETQETSEVYVEALQEACLREETEFVDAALMNALKQLSTEESQICERLEMAKAEEALIKENMEKRSLERKRKQEEEHAACLKKEISIWHEIREDLKSRFRCRQEKRFKENQKQKEQERRENLKICREIAWSVVSLVELEREYRQRLGPGSIPRSVIQEWRQLFVTNDERIRIFHLERVHLPAEVLQELVQREIIEYLELKKDWSEAQEVPERQEIENQQLSRWIGEIAAEFYRSFQGVPEDSVDLQAHLNKLKLRIAVVGPPCCGCTTVSESLRSEFGATILGFREANGRLFHFHQTATCL